MMDEALSALGRGTWQGSVAIIAVYWLCRRFPKTPPALTCRLWRLVGLKFLLTLALALAPPVSLPLPPVSDRIIPTTISPLSETPKIAPLFLRAETNRQPDARTEAPKMPPVFSSLWDWRTTLLALYGVGLIIAFMRSVRAALLTWRLVRMAVPVDAEVRAIAAELAGAMRLRQVPRVAHTTEADSPLLAFGTILLPKSMPPSALPMMLAHELAHVRRRDLLWEWTGTLTQILFWFHPLIPLARREERLARESAADALTLQTTNAPAAEYGQLLLSLSVGSRRLPLTGAVGAAETGSLLRRLTALGAAPDLRGNRRLRGAVIALGLVGSLSLIPLRLIRAEAQPPVAVPAKEPPSPSGGAELVAVITAADGTPRVGGPVSLRKFIKTPEGNVTVREVAKTTTDAKGRLRFEALEPGKYFVSVEAPKGKQESALSFQIALDDKKRSLALQIPPLSKIAGRLTFRGTGRAAVEARVLAHVALTTGPDPEDRQLTLQSYTDTNTDGRYTLPLGAGKATVMATGYSRRVGRKGEYQGMEELEDQRATVSVRAGQTATQNFTVLPVAALKFAEVSGNPVAGVSVTLLPEDRAAPDSYTTTGTSDNDGILPLRSFSSGTFRAEKGALSANGSFKRDVQTGALAFRTETQKGTAEDGRAIIFLTATPSVMLIGQVTDEDGKPIPNARITRNELDPKSHVVRREAASRTQAEGRFTLPLALDGEYYLYVRADGYNQVDVFNAIGFTPTRGETKDVGTITLRKAEGTVSGQVVGEDGKPIAGVLACVRGEVTFQSAAVTDAEGRFRIPNVVKGEEVELTLWRQGEARDSGAPLFQSNDTWIRRSVKASDKPLKIGVPHQRAASTA